MNEFQLYVIILINLKNGCNGNAVGILYFFAFIQLQHEENMGPHTAIWQLNYSFLDYSFG